MTEQERLISFLNNTAPIERVSELGIFRFAKYFFPDRFNDEFSKTHYKMLGVYFSMYNPSNTLSLERQRYILIHREAAKTTIFSFLIPMYAIYVKGLPVVVSNDLLGIDGEGSTEIKIDEKFIVISSETSTRAESFVTSIKSEIETNKELLKFFGEKDPRVIEETKERKKSSKMWRLTSFITKDNTTVWALGAGQQTRGMNVLGSRPTLWITDDMYSGNNTKTETTREKLNYWFSSEVLNSLDSKNGKTIWLGTMVHPDTVVKDFRTLESWKGLELSVLSVPELREVVKELTTDKGFVLPDKKWCIQRQQSLVTLSWPERHNLYSILLKYYDHLKKKRLNYYYQEYMNEPLAPEAAIIKPESFYATEINVRVKNGISIVSFFKDGFEWEGIYEPYIGCDPASSTTTSSDDTAFVVFGYARCFPSKDGYEQAIMRRQYPIGKVFPVIAHVEGGKFADLNYTVGNETLPGKVETMAHMVRRFGVKTVKIETNARAIELFRVAHTFFQQNHVPATVWGEVSEGKKEDRILSIVLPIVQGNECVICPDTEVMDKLYNQLIALGMGAHDDYADAFAIAAKNAVIPTTIYSEEVVNRSREIDRIAFLKERFGDEWKWHTHLVGLTN